jgi:hypothetical protein
MELGNLKERLPKQGVFLAERAGFEYDPLNGDAGT